MSKLVKDETKRLLEVINEQIENLLSYDNQIPIIEIDLTKESIRKLYQQLDYLSKPLDKNKELEKIINKTNQETEDLLDKAEEEFSSDKNKEPEQKLEDTENDNLKEASKTEMNGSEQIKETVKKEEIKEDKSKQQEIISDKKSSSDKPGEEKPLEKTPAPKKPQRVQRSIIDVVASEEETNLGDTFQESNITNLKSAIGINDKFQFINELFEGSMSNYNSFIKKVDSMDEKDSALKEFEAAKQENNWNKEDGAYQLMENYINRRFG